MTKIYVPYQKPARLLCFNEIGIDSIRLMLSQRIHSLSNQQSTDAFLDHAACYFAPRVMYEVAVQLCQEAGVPVPPLALEQGPGSTQQRRQVIESLVDVLKTAGAIEKSLLTTPAHYCGRFKVCIGRGYRDVTSHYLWLVPITAAFFWGDLYDGVERITKVIGRRRLTGLADLLYVTPIRNVGGRQ